MHLAEFTAYWVGNYTPEQAEHYRAIHGYEESAWPPTQDVAPITIDLHRVCRFNPHHDADKTTVELAGTFSFALIIGYAAFKEIMREVNGDEIKSYKNKKHALPNRNK